MSDAELVAHLMMIASKHENIENSEDRWRHPPYLPQSDRNVLRAAAARLSHVTEAMLILGKGAKS